MLVYLSYSDKLKLIPTLQLITLSEPDQCLSASIYFNNIINVATLALYPVRYLLHGSRGMLNTINEYKDRSGKSPYGRWLESIKNPRARARIIMHVDKMELGLFGDIKQAQKYWKDHERRENQHT